MSTMSFFKAVSGKDSDNNERASPPAGNLNNSHVDSVRCHMTDLSRWPIFSILDPDVLSTIKKVCVFGSSGNEAIFITDDDDVFAIGSNCSSCLGLGDTHSSFVPRKIEILCRKKIADIAFGSGPHVLAVSGSGEVFSWGHNGYCQLGNGGSNQGFLPALVTTNLQGKRVAQVACGGHHSMALTADGEIYAWGQNNCGQVGTGTTSNQPTPRRITAVIGCRPAVALACGQTTSMALMDNGELFGWGYNGNGQLGVGNNVNQPNPCRVLGALTGLIISKVVCGYAHTMALTDEGVLYSWGANSYGQLGTSSKANQVYPTKVDFNSDRFVEIAGCHYSHISAAVSQSGRVYMWGQCRGQSVTIPMLTRFTCTDDVFATFSSPSISWRTYCVDHVRSSRVTHCISNAFDDPITSDLKFVVEGKDIYVHKSILKIRCQHFRSMFQSCWDEDGKESLEITQYTYAVYKAFLQYLYTDYVTLEPEEAIGLLDLANAYCEPILKNKCEQIIKQGIAIDNVAMLYAAAIKFDARNLEDFCFRFALNHMTAVTQSDAFNKLDETVLKEFIRKAALAGAFKY
ncbi:RCC1 and BTB domain-containing protein 1-like [Gigantopelta aegis]|uniref:RCC1 and BTB domain-containing protein 1-like n=1 Tax=Gigantopelta aegis TaxID=1735272 RepID=UPI001B88DC66|nr:RCC1 and BTB domain-containing protein 1-like [Gigantopelta aegis]